MARTITGAERQARYRARRRLSKIDVDQTALQLLKGLRDRTQAGNIAIVTSALEYVAGLTEWRPGDSHWVSPRDADAAARATAETARRKLLDCASKGMRQRWESKQAFLRPWISAWYVKNQRSTAIPLSEHWKERRRLEDALYKAASRFFKRKGFKPGVVAELSSAARLIGVPLWDRGWTVEEAVQFAPQWWQILSCYGLMTDGHPDLLRNFRMSLQGTMKHRTFSRLSEAGLTAADVVPLDPIWWKMLNEVESWIEPTFQEEERLRWGAVISRLKRTRGIALNDRDSGKPTTLSYVTG
jgi:hypothetical protein